MPQSGEHERGSRAGDCGFPLPERLPEAGDLRERRRALRAWWRSATLAAGWPFPGDWSCSGVDQVCDALLGRGELFDALAELGQQRARAGIGLDETLSDLAALYEVVAGAGEGVVLARGDCSELPAEPLRTVAVSWADVTAGRSASREVVDALTGLTTGAYLRMRLYEVYRETAGAEHGDRREGRDHYGLLVVTLCPAEGADRWTHLMGVVLAADVLRTEFDAGETVSLLRESTPVVLARQRAGLAERRRRAERTIAERLRSDPELARACASGEGPRLRWLRLPAEYAQACALIDSLC
ncbi:hypothetical protein [Actinopolyspora mortivallis]|uniref:Uncharacterized protein n=1 Tax=Actinopolyspora mortivallis TaxID=33906 RepID=A0A2T0GU76_ACTMO|nr:hypothetical protein [Actinopolyspora mortivallis]PRW62650.1 hypothetical protein CEP50_14125 [Actinopolyspora mortivallis]